MLERLSRDSCRYTEAHIDIIFAGLLSGKIRTYKVEKGLLIDMQICFSIFFILVGLFALFAEDSAWQWQVFKNRMGGLPSERTDEWEIGRVIGGILLVIIGVISFILLTSGQ